MSEDIATEGLRECCEAWAKTHGVDAIQVYMRGCNLLRVGLLGEGRAKKGVKIIFTNEERRMVEAALSLTFAGVPPLVCTSILRDRNKLGNLIEAVKEAWDFVGLQ